jgi:HTH-type transcriptional regulator/antitoxin HipB
MLPNGINISPTAQDQSLMNTFVPDRGSVGTFVRERRRANDLTQRQLADLAGVGVRFVSELERNKPTLRMDSVNAVLAVLGKRLGVVELPRDAEPTQ